jgi:hypothetical protein
LTLSSLEDTILLRSLWGCLISMRPLL